MNIEQFVIGYLSSASALAGIPVRGNVPHPIPEKFITVEKTGSGCVNYINTATIAVQSWAASRAEAAALNETVKALMDEIINNSEISRCALNSDYNFTDLSRNHPRYQAVYDLVY